MVTSAGIIIPSGSLLVLALNCLQNSMMFTPCGPSAVPTGGAGFAAPAGHWSFTTATTFLAIRLLVAKATGGMPAVGVSAAITRAVAGGRRKDGRTES